MKHQQLSRANGTKRPFLLALIAFSLGFCHYAEAKVQPTEAFTSNVDSLIINDNNKDKDEINEHEIFMGDLPLMKQ